MAVQTEAGDVDAAITQLVADLVAFNAEVNTAIGAATITATEGAKYKAYAVQAVHQAVTAGFGGTANVGTVESRVIQDE
jgi:hypothetical protein